MKTKHLLIAVFIVTWLSASITLTSCKKEEKPTPELTTKIEKVDELLTFYSITLGIKEEMIKYNRTTNEFYVPNTNVRESLKSIQYHYERADLSNVNNQ